LLPQELPQERRVLPQELLQEMLPQELLQKMPQLLRREFGDLTERMEWERQNMLQRFNKSYNDKKALGLPDTAAGDAALAKRHGQWIAQIMRTVARQGILALQKAFIREGDHSPSQDVFRSILCTSDMMKVAQGLVFDAKWATEVWLHPLIQALVALKYHFENLNEVTNVNLATELAEILQLAPNSSIQAIIQRLEKVIDPVAKTYTTVPDLLAYLKASVQYEIIRRRSRKLTTNGQAWKQGYNRLREALTAGGKLTPALLQQAIQLAESHLRENEIEEIEEITTPGIARQAKVDDGDSSSEPSGDAPSKKKRKKNRVAKLRAQLSKFKAAEEGPPGPKPPGSKPGQRTADCSRTVKTRRVQGELEGGDFRGPSGRRIH
jgi:hypothetical protein